MSQRSKVPNAEFIHEYLQLGIFGKDQNSGVVKLFQSTSIPEL